MLSFPLSLALIPYGLAVLFFALMAFINVYHVARFGATNMVTFTVTFLFLAGAAFILFFTWQAVAGTDWSQPIVIGMPGSASSSFGLQ